MKLSTLEKIFHSLNLARVKYLVAGGLAVNAHGYQRMTSDLDMVIQLNAKNIKNAMNCLAQLGYQPIVPVTSDDFANEEKRKDWIKHKNMQVLSLQSTHHPETTVDLFVTEPFNFDVEYQQSTLAQLSEHLSFRIISINTLIEMKTEANRAKDIDDIDHLKIILNEQHES